MSVFTGGPYGRLAVVLSLNILVEIIIIVTAISIDCINPYLQVLSQYLKTADFHRMKLINEPVHEKTNNLGFRPGPTQTGLYSHRSRLEA